jgi:hypothetical protein
MLIRIFLGLLALSLTLMVVPSSAQAEIYKYIDKNGNVVYTDSLSALPAKRRAKYVKRQRDRKQKREALEKRVGKDELERREMETKMRALDKKTLGQREYSARKSALSGRLRDYDRRRKERKDKIQGWQGQMDALKSRLRSKVAEFDKTKKEFQQAAFQYSSTAMLIHAQNREKASKKLKILEKEIDALMQKIKVDLPAKARAAGVRVH